VSAGKTAKDPVNDDSKHRGKGESSRYRVYQQELDAWEYSGRKYPHSLPRGTGDENQRRNTGKDKNANNYQTLCKKVQ
jgi:hypothetical protein